MTHCTGSVGAPLVPSPHATCDIHGPGRAHELRTRIIDRGDAVAPIPGRAACLHAGLPDQPRCRIPKLAADQAESWARIDSVGWLSCRGELAMTGARGNRRRC